MSTAAIVAARRRRILKAFREGRALSGESARPLGELGIDSSLLVRSLVRAGVIVESTPERFFLDEAAAAAADRARLRFFVLALVVLAMAIAVILTRG